MNRCGPIPAGRQARSPWRHTGGQMFVAGNAYLDNADAKEPDGYPTGEFIRAYWY